MLKIKSHDCREELREVDLKATDARIAILRLLESADHPIDAANIMDSLQKKNINADPATVFRIINVFTEKGIARQIQFHEGKFRYELASRADHHHFICENCGAIEDISDCNILGLEESIQKKGLLVKRHSLEFFGLCQNCQK